jgi:photosystem II stability/assembly factor-like uncharacterized protein
MRAIVVLAILAVASAAPAWKVLKNDLDPVLMGISFLDNQTGFMAGGQDGTPPEGGPQVYKTTDGGNNWTWLPHGGSAMMFLDVAMGTKTNGVTAGIGLLGIVPGVEYTMDGNTFNATSDVELEEECQSTETIRGMTGGYGLTGGFGKANGVAISTDKGRTFSHFDANVNTSTRYGSFPSPKVWYLSAGQWPETGRKNGQGIKHLTERISMERVNGEDNSINYRVNYRLYDEAAPSRIQKQNDNNTYIAAIVKTTDAGATWQTVFYDAGNFYFNAISCPSELHCFAVGEADDGPAPGARIYHTADGGKTWEVQMFQTNPAYSLMAIEFIDENTGWAAGGELDAHFKGHFWFTSNAGKTWTLNILAGVYGNDMSFIGTAQSYKGFATAFTWDDQSSVLVYM